MSKIEVEVIDQIQNFTNMPVIASGDINADRIKFTFSEEWAGYSKICTFYQQKGEYYYGLVDSNNEVVIPNGVINKPGNIHFGVSGFKDEITRTSNVLTYAIVEGAYTEVDESESQRLISVIQENVDERREEFDSVVDNLAYLRLEGDNAFEYNENFDYPYMAKNVREFWNRWHISLGKWFKEYVYIPLGGNRKGINRTYINLIIVFFLTGLWHGANYTFILWGLYHGLWSLLERTKWKNFIERHSVFAHLYLTVIVILGWIMFRSDNIYNALQIYLRMFFPMRYIDDWTVLSINVREMVAYLTLGLLGVGIIPTYLSSLVEKYRYTWIELVWCIFIYALSFLSIASGTYNPFIYYQF